MKVLTTHTSARLIASVLLLAAASLTASHAQTANTHPLTGTWSWTLYNGTCNETLQYRADGVLLSTSGDAVTEWRYAASSAPDAQGFYKLDEISTRHNSKKDCSGDVVDEAGLDATRFVKLNPAKDRMIICRSASLQACYGPLQRLP
jgi:hypothetical protein